MKKTFPSPVGDYDSSHNNVSTISMGKYSRFRPLSGIMILHDLPQLMARKGVCVFPSPVGDYDSSLPLVEPS